ncbi:hypothetical protein [Soonwooa sp.]|uniref:hypothetical protein n=1 Tax=Soonwooa sp. TaxID=1938592 RepID=UPI0026271C5F|nr:hypothetical protein [Soonwooa sp.]
MGFDISYHPISETEIKNWYFDTLATPARIPELASEYKIDDFYKSKFFELISVALGVLPTHHFEKTHGYFIAVTQGFFRTYYYTRGSAFSFLIEDKPSFKNYTKSWQDIVDFEIENPVHNKIFENYSSGVYIPADKVVALLSDYETNAHVKEELDSFFSDGRIDVFLAALKHSKELGAGLLEATEVVEPNPFEMEKSISYSNLFNCDKEGVYLYIDAAAEQMREIEKAHNLKQGEISQNADYVKINVEAPEKPEKKSFWQKLFGK